MVIRLMKVVLNQCYVLKNVMIGMSNLYLLKTVGTGFLMEALKI